jgi:hypothetical protein
MAANPTRPNIVKDNGCPFCMSTVRDLKDMKRYGDLVEVPCRCCGTYRITATAIDVLPNWDPEPRLWAAIAYQVRKMTGRAEPPRLDTEVLRALRDTAKLPHPDQIIEDFVLWAGVHSRWPGDAFDIRFESHRTLLGAVDRGAFDYMVDSIGESGYFNGTLSKFVDSPSTMLECSLRPHGWNHFRELSAAQAETRYGFMAMKYGEAEGGCRGQQPLRAPGAPCGL